MGWEMSLREEVVMDDQEERKREKERTKIIGEFS